MCRGGHIATCVLRANWRVLRRSTWTVAFLCLFEKNTQKMENTAPTFTPGGDFAALRASGGAPGGLGAFFIILFTQIGKHGPQIYPCFRGDLDKKHETSDVLPEMSPKNASVRGYCRKFLLQGVPHASVSCSVSISYVPWWPYCCLCVACQLACIAAFHMDGGVFVFWGKKSKNWKTRPPHLPRGVNLQPSGLPGGLRGGSGRF
jgi:hypothetical protein